MKRILLLPVISALMAVIPISKAAAQTVWHNPEDAGINLIQGQAYDGQERESFYHRFPKSAEGKVRPRVWGQSRQTAGESIVFTTDAKNIYIRYGVSLPVDKLHMPATGVSGIDLYTHDRNGGEVWLAGKFEFADTLTYRFRSIEIADKPKKAQRYTLFLPLYNEVMWMEIGTEKGASFRFEPVLPAKPIVAYGTSICQGASASRPGMAWTNILQRRLGTEVVNLGVSGAAMLESEVIDLVAQVDAKAYIIDAMPNAAKMKLEVLKDTLAKALRQLRTAKPEVPIILADHLGYPHSKAFKSRKENETRALEAQKYVYAQLVAEGMKGLYHLTYEQLAMPQDAWVEGVHPSDYGMSVYAGAYEKILREVLHMPAGDVKTTVPVTQQRDPYIWMDRHAHILREGSGKHFTRVLIGDSIMHFWGGADDAPATNGPKTWEGFKGTSFNMGCGYDKVENVLWRIYNGQLDELTADKIFLAIGTNNFRSPEDSEDIMKGLSMLIDAIAVRRPEAELTLMAVLPRRGKEAQIKDLNKLYKAMAKEKGIGFADPGKVLLTRDGKVDDSLFTDGLHPNEDGYSRIAPWFE